MFGSSQCPFRGSLGARWFWWYDKHFVGRSRTETTCEAPRFSFTVPNHVYCPTSTAPTLRFDLKIRRLDFFTKGLTIQKFAGFRDLLMGEQPLKLMQPQRNQSHSD